MLLAGGSSRRLGSDKAVALVGGRPLWQTGVQALAGAGCEPIAIVGRSGLPGPGTEAANLGTERNRRISVEFVADEFPGEGPLGGLVTGLRHHTAPLSAVVSCDLPFIDATTLRRLIGVAQADLDAGTTGAGAIAVADERRQWLIAVYRTALQGQLEQAFLAGERSLRRALGSVNLIEVALTDPRVARDVDTPDDLTWAQKQPKGTKYP